MHFLDGLSTLACRILWRGGVEGNGIEPFTELFKRLPSSALSTFNCDDIVVPVQDMVYDTKFSSWLLLLADQPTPFHSVRSDRTGFASADRMAW